MEKINNYKSILLDVLENTNYKRLILCENINGFIYKILTEKGIKFKNYENIKDIDISFDDDNFFNNVFAAAFGDAFLSFILLVGDSILFESLNLDEPREPDLNNLSEPDVFMLILLGDISL